MTLVTTAPNGTTLSVLQTVFESILEVFLLCFAGWVLARRGLLDKKTQKKLNRINVSIFTPALLFSKVAFFLTPHKLRELWIIPFIFVIVTLTSFTIASITSRLFRLKRTQRSFAIAAAMFMNSNSLPIALMQSLVVTVHGLKWGSHDTKDGMLGRALTYLVLHSTLGMMLRWSYGVHLLAQADDEPEGVQKVSEDERPGRADDRNTRSIEREQHESSSNANEREPLLKHSKFDYSSTTLRSQHSVSFTNEDSFYYGHPGADGDDPPPSRPRTPQSVVSPALRSALRRSQVNMNANTDTGVSGTDNQGENPVRTDTLAIPEFGRSVRPPMVNKQSHFFYSFPNTPTLSRVSLAAPASPPENLPLPAATATNTSSETTTDRIKTFFNTTLPERWKKTVKSVKDFMTAPMYAALLSLFVACIPPLQHVLDVHLLPVKGAIASAGNCSIPVTLIVLGGYFYREDDGNSGDEGGLKTDLPQQKTTAATAVASSAVIATAIGSSGSARKRKPIAFVGNENTTDDFVAEEDVSKHTQERTSRNATSPPIQRPISDATLIGTSTGRFSRHSRNASSTSQQENFHSNSNGDANGLPHFSATLLPPPNGVPTSPTNSTSNSAHKGERTTVWVAILARMILTPLVLLPIMALVAAKTDMRLFDDPVFVVSNVLFISSPPALTLAQITQAASGDAFERLISKTIFWSYCVVTPITTMIYVFIGLQLSKL